LEISLIKTQIGLIPADEDEQEKLKKIKTGSVVTCEMRVRHGWEFHKKVFSLMRICYDHFCESSGFFEKLKDESITPSFDVFREDFLILSGHYTKHFSINGTLTLKAKSLSFKGCTHEQKEEIYSSLIDTALRHIYKDGSLNESELRAMTEKILSYT
jgi:hypothetical protein